MHPNEQLIRDAYEAMGRGDGSSLANLLHAETEWIIRGDGELAGTYRGPEEIFGFWRGVANKTGGGLKLTVRDVLANDQRAVVLVDVAGERSGRILAERQIAIFELGDSKVDSATFVYERPTVYDAFWETLD